MHLLFYLISWLGLFLITIGDVVYAVISVLFFIVSAFFKSIKRIVSGISTSSKKSFAGIGSRLKRNKQNSSLTLKNRTHSTRKKRYQTISPILTKLRYFFIGFLFSAFFIFLPLIIYVFLQDLPHPNELVTRQIPQTTKIYDRHGTLLYELYASQNRTLVPLSSIPRSLQQATLAIEDKNFYKHPGFDISSIIRALKEDHDAGKILQGGSTITQQLIKSSMLTPEQSITRKAKEIVLAFWAERTYSKDQILEMYFNQVPYGGTAWGIEAASETYFDKNVKDLDLAQSAFLAGLTQSPTRYSPYGENPTLWKNRQKEVLSRMVALKYISDKQAKEAEKEQLQFSRNQDAFKAPHFVNYVKDYLVKKYGLAMVEKGGLQVTTSLDLSLQNKVQDIVRDEVNRDAYLNLTNGAAVVADPKNGDILAMVGSKDFNDPNGGNVNVTTALRQPGSSIKPVTYAAALSNGFTAASVLDDSPVSFPTGSGTYSPVNYDGKFHGKISLRLSLANSLNIPAVKTLQAVGVPTMVHLARDMGVKSWDPDGDYGLSITLGAAEVTMLDMVTVNGTLANGGKRVDLNPILKITNYKGATLDDKRTVPFRQILQPGVAYIISSILSDNPARSMEFGPNSPLNIPGHTVSVKTGTTDNKRDNWTNGYTSDYVVSVWVGNNDNSPMSQALASGITGAAPIWNRVMTLLLTNKPDTKMAIPDEIIGIPCNGRTEYFLKGTETNANCRQSFFTSTPKPSR
jgi:1A family penicillin-binding protein